MEELVCPVCATALPAHPRLCPRCATPHHVDCWAYVGHCAVFGCEPGAPRLPADPRELERTRRLLNGWYWTFRLQWGAFLLLTLPLLALAGAGFLFPILVSLPGGVGTDLFEVLVASVVFLCPAGALAWILLALPAVGLRVLLEGRLGGSLATPGGSNPALAARIEPLSLARRFEMALPAAARVYSLVVLTAALFGTVLAALEGPGPFAATFMIGLLAVGAAAVMSLIALGVAQVGTARALYVATVQNRLVSSAKQPRLPART